MVIGHARELHQAVRKSRSISHLPESTGPNQKLVYAALWAVGNSSAKTMISGAGGRFSSGPIGQIPPPAEHKIVQPGGLIAIHPAVGLRDRKQAWLLTPICLQIGLTGFTLLSHASASHAGKIDVRIDSRPYVLVAGKSGPKLFGGNCPHVGVLLKDGHSDDSVLTCPEHGLEFDLSSGESACGLFRLASRSITVDGDVIRLGDLSPRAAE